MEVTHPTIQDLDAIMEVERSSFDPQIADSKASMEERIKIINDTFLTVRNEEEQVIGYIVGPVSDDLYLTDDLFEHIGPNPNTGGVQIILSLAIHPDARGNQIGTYLLESLEKLAIHHKRSAISLTCLEHLISYYDHLGFDNHGVAQSTYGGMTWYNMIKPLNYD
ncbi:GNAT family N-acetyltransferase [Aerococcaceae bacterium DSM 111176]|nr:GNAT family N-acetyltransferase [Aerococcaceae bacterium DSM 111176]